MRLFFLCGFAPMLMCTSYEREFCTIVGKMDIKGEKMGGAFSAFQQFAVMNVERRCLTLDGKLSISESGKAYKL